MAEQGPPDATEQPLNVEARFRHGAFVFRFKGTGIRAVSDKKRTVVVTLEELLTGVTRVLRLTRRVRCDACGGTGSARPDERKTCELCGGPGRAPHLPSLRRQPRPYDQMITSMCAACGGRGKLRGDACPACAGEAVVEVEQNVTVVVPAGAPSGHEIVFPGLGDEHVHRATGNLVVTVEVAQHPVFERVSPDGADIWRNASVGLLDALYGFEKRLTGLDGTRLTMRHTRVAFSSFTHELRGHGLPVSGNETERGSLTVYVSVSFPKSLSTLQFRILRQIGLRKDELDFIYTLQLLMAYQYAQTVPDDADELKFARRCYVDALDSCIPDPRYSTWWRAVV